MNEPAFYISTWSRLPVGHALYRRPCWTEQPSFFARYKLPDDDSWLSHFERRCVIAFRFGLVLVSSHISLWNFLHTIRVQCSTQSFRQVTNTAPNGQLWEQPIHGTLAKSTCDIFQCTSRSLFRSQLLHHMIITQPVACIHCNQFYHFVRGALAYLCKF